MWPYICQFVDKLFRETIEPAVKGANPHLSSFCFSKIDMGDKPLRVNGVKVYTENVDKRQIIMDLQISFVGNTEIDVDIKKYYCRAGIKSIQLHGVMRVVMEPLLGDMPLIGALSVFFLKKPDREIVFITGLPQANSFICEWVGWVAGVGEREGVSVTAPSPAPNPDRIMTFACGYLVSPSWLPLGAVLHAGFDRSSCCVDNAAFCLSAAESLNSAHPGHPHHIV
ncbi:hypothetical protein JZ751_000034 [Albula glossodonta]|uniref:Synaptotagmin SMP domain-containing protein n=1 Tax=Albula glossodonta TaxID=121402 RepID=A0A8T2PVE3_9TELE|nr:hypothetical protein JZ751_000034 [Albula glossodonta]